MATKTRAELIALLKSRGIKGRLSKMTKAQLLTKVEKTAPPTTQTREKEVAPTAIRGFLTAQREKTTKSAVCSLKVMWEDSVHLRAVLGP